MPGSVRQADTTAGSPSRAREPQVPVTRPLALRPSARRHGIDEADIQHARVNAVGLVEYDYEGEDRLLVIGPNRHGRTLELVTVPDEND